MHLVGDKEKSTLSVNLRPSLKSAIVGESVSFHCDSDISVLWHFNGGSLPPNAHLRIPEKDENSHEVLDIFNVNMKNAGIYSCHAVGAGMETVQSEGVLMVQGK